MVELLTTSQLAQYLGLSKAALEKWRLEGRGPKFRKLAHAVRYHPQDVEEWLVSRTRTSTSATPSSRSGEPDDAKR